MRLERHVEAGPSSRPTSPSSTTSRRTSTPSKDHVLESTKQTEMEMQLRRTIREDGEPRHEEAEETEGKGVKPVLELGGEEGLRRRSREKTIVLDLGNGPEDVILIDWAEGDPEVRTGFTTRGEAECL